MNSNKKCIDPKKMAQLVTDMKYARFNDQNPLINNIRNHVSIENYINREIPSVQNKIDLLTNGPSDPSDSTIDKHIPTLKEFTDEVVESVDEDNNEQNNSCVSSITIAKLIIITIIIALFISAIVYMYIDTPYMYYIIGVVIVIALGCDYYIYMKWTSE